VLHFDQLDVLPDNTVKLFEDLHSAIIKAMAERFARLMYVDDWLAWQMQGVLESGGVYEDALNAIETSLPLIRRVAEEGFLKAGVKSTQFDDKLYKEVGLEPIPLNLSKPALRVLRAGFDKTMRTLVNLTRTTAINVRNDFIEQADLAYMKVVSGMYDHKTALREGVITLTERGIYGTKYASGHYDQIDVAARRAMLTGVGQTVGELALSRAMEMGVDLVETSAHIGARNRGAVPENHEMWQGRVFSISGKSDKYPDFRKITGYGTGAGLCGWNCRHSFFPFFYIGSSFKSSIVDADGSLANRKGCEPTWQS